jgi:hypothetical protein
MNLMGNLGGMVRAALPDLDALDTEALKELIIAHHNDKWTINGLSGHLNPS